MNKKPITIELIDCEHFSDSDKKYTHAMFEGSEVPVCGIDLQDHAVIGVKGPVTCGVCQLGLISPLDSVETEKPSEKPELQPA